jgi:hypothetical protein
MEALIIVLVLVALVAVVLGIRWYVLCVSTLKVHRRAMAALADHIARQNPAVQVRFPQQAPAPEQERGL